MVIIAIIITIMILVFFIIAAIIGLAILPMSTSSSSSSSCPDSASSPALSSSFVGISNFVSIVFILIDADIIVIVIPLQTSLSSVLSSSSLPLPPTAICGSEGGTCARTAMASAPSQGLLSVDASHTAMESGGARPSQASKDDAGVLPAKRARCHNRISSFTVGSFDFGFEDTLMTTSNKYKNIRNFERVCGKIVELGNCDILFGCGVGALRRALDDRGMNVTDTLKQPFGERVCCSQVSKYLSAWSFGSDHQPVSVSLLGKPEIFHVPSQPEIDAMILRFDVRKRGHARVHVIAGNMHFPCNGPASVLPRKVAVSALKGYLDGLAATEKDAPVVCIMLGDNHLDSQQAREAVQSTRNNEAVWTVVSSMANLKGDNMAVSGATSRIVPVAVGASFEDPGTCNGTHDALVVEITPSGASQPAVGTKRKRRDESSEDTSIDASTLQTPAPTSEFEPDYGRETSESASEVDDEIPNRETAVEIVDGNATEELEDDPRRHARELHDDMKRYWDHGHDEQYDPKVMRHLSRVLFKNRKDTRPHEEDRGMAFASQQETARAIAAAIRSRQEFLSFKNIDHPRHVLTGPERQELVVRAREVYAQTPLQRELEQRDATTAAGGGAPMRNARGKRRANDSASIANFVRQQRRKRWHRHLQRVWGSKQIWEMIVFTGRFDVNWLERALRTEAVDAPAGPVTGDDATKEHRLRLHHAKAEAIARYKEGARLARYRDMIEGRGASQPAAPRVFTKRQLRLLHQFDNDELRINRNNAVQALGHGQLRNRRGDIMDIGGSTGGVTRRVLDNWQQPDFREFLRDDYPDERNELCTLPCSSTRTAKNCRVPEAHPTGESLV